MYKSKMEKGVSIYLVILISRIKVSHEIGYSVVALYAADTGIERILYAIRKEDPPYEPSTCTPTPCLTPYQETLGNYAHYDVYIKNVSATTTQINSIGNYQAIKRAIEISY